LVERHTFCKVCAKCIKTELVDSFYPQYKERTLIKVCEECKQKIIIEKEQSKIKQKQE
jgi:phage tail sheath gpL-like